MPGAWLNVLVAIDDSRGSEAAVQTAVKFPWPERTRAHGVVALRAGYFGLRSKELDDALEHSLRTAAASARDVLASRWIEADVRVIDKAPLDAILGEARRVHADVIVLGWRGHGSFQRLVAGSVSRAVAARAECSILVARAAPETLHRFVVGYDGGANARRALKLLSRMEPGRGMRAVLVNVINTFSLPARSARLPSRLRTNIRSDMTAINAERKEEAQAALDSGAARLRSAGWTANTELRTGSALAGLSNAMKAHRADVLVLGARETGGLTRALLGSVAEGALNNSRIPVLLVR